MASFKRHAYNAEFKLKAAEHAAAHGNRATAREFNVNESMVRKWRKQQDDLRQVKKTRQSFRGNKARWIQLEDKLEQWVIEQREASRSVSTVTIRMQATVLARELNIHEFKGGPSWCFRFMKRRNLHNFTRANVKQRQPKDHQEKLAALRAYNKNKTTEKQTRTEHITTADEVLLALHVPVDKTEARTVNVCSTGREKSPISCQENVPKPPPMVIIKKKTSPKENCPVVVEASLNGWMDEDTMRNGPVTTFALNWRVEEPKLENAHVHLEDFVEADHNDFCQSANRGTESSKECLYKDLLRTDTQCVFHTGLPRPTFHLLAESLFPFYSGSSELDPVAQLLMTLMKLKLNLPDECLADQFATCQSSVSSTLVHWMDLMETHLRSFVPWLRKETVVKTMPRFFREHYPGTTCVIDYLEIHLHHQQSLDFREGSHGLHRGQKTMRFMVAVAPCGLITFVSPAYGGRCSDQFILSESGFLEYLRPGDEVMTFGGFGIAEALGERGVKLVVPAHTDGDFQLSGSDARSRSFAGVRTLKRFKILSETMPISLVPMTDKILRICAALCNLQGESLHEE